MRNSISRTLWISAAAFVLCQAELAGAAAPNAKPLEGKVAIVTGSARNLGRAYAVGLAAHGADVAVHYRDAGDRADAEETARAIRSHGTRAVLVSGDLCEVATIRKIFDDTHEAFGRIDIVVNNAGAMVKKPIAEVTEQEFDRAFCVNAKGTFFVLQEAAKRLENDGRIINMGTSLMSSVTPSYAVYAGSKVTMEAFTRALAREIGERGITVNVIAPGPIDTPFYHSVETPQSVAYATNLSVAKRLGHEDDIVPLVQFLASPGAQWITAQTIFINGGYFSR